MASLVPGANAAITAENPGIDELLFGFGWDVVPSRGPQAELVPLAIVCGHDGRALSSDHLVFFNQLMSADGSVTFADARDEEEIDIDLRVVPDEVDRFVFVVYVDPDVRGPGDFSSVRSAFVRVCARDGRELVRFDVPLGDVASSQAVLFGELYRHRDGWRFRALGQGYGSGLQGLADDFGIEL